MNDLILDKLKDKLFRESEDCRGRLIPITRHTIWYKCTGYDIRLVIKGFIENGFKELTPILMVIGEYECKSKIFHYSNIAFKDE